MPASPALETSIYTWAHRLEKTYPHIQSCSVVIDQPHHHHAQGNLFQVRLVIAIPDHVIVVARDDGSDHAHEDVHVALSDAFVAARRQLRDYARV
ncbi:MAG: HPF/RaiA family ribosome-associated protein, partial [Proteobacteria bacterium]|nr:HPF/RaiA family ribosome-associated protein [Pseudomonadota bacterium]